MTRYCFELGLDALGSDPAFPTHWRKQNNLRVRCHPKILSLHLQFAWLWNELRLQRHGIPLSEQKFREQK